MSGDNQTSEPTRSPLPSTSAAAKHRLLHWSKAADAELAAQVHSTVGSVVSSARKALPWVGGIAAIAGILIATSPRKQRERPGDAGRPEKRPSFAAQSLLTLALQYAPLALKLLQRSRPRED